MQKLKHLIKLLNKMDGVERTIVKLQFVQSFNHLREGKKK